MHLESAFVSHRAALASLLDQSQLHGGSVATTNTYWFLIAVASTLHTEVLAAETSMHLVSASASYSEAPASLLDQSEPHGGSVAKTNTCRRLIAVASTLHLGAASSDEHAH